MSPYSLGGLILGFFAIVAHVIRNRKQPDVATVLTLLISSVGACGGIKVFRYSVSGDFAAAIAKVPTMTADDSLYFALGGVAITWLSAQTVWKQIIGNSGTVVPTAAASNLPTSTP